MPGQRGKKRGAKFGGGGPKMPPKIFAPKTIEEPTGAPPPTPRGVPPPDLGTKIGVRDDGTFGGKDPERSAEDKLRARADRGTSGSSAPTTLGEAYITTGNEGTLSDTPLPTGTYGRGGLVKTPTEIEPVRIGVDEAVSEMGRDHPWMFEGADHPALQGEAPTEAPPPPPPEVAPPPDDKGVIYGEEGGLGPEIPAPTPHPDTVGYEEDAPPPMYITPSEEHGPLEVDPETGIPKQEQPDLPQEKPPAPPGEEAPYDPATQTPDATTVPSAEDAQQPGVWDEYKDTVKNMAGEIREKNRQQMVADIEGTYQDEATMARHAAEAASLRGSAYGGGAQAGSAQAALEGSRTRAGIKSAAAERDQQTMQSEINNMMSMAVKEGDWDMMERAQDLQRELAGEGRELTREGWAEQASQAKAQRDYAAGENMLNRLHSLGVLDKQTEANLNYLAEQGKQGDERAEAEYWRQLGLLEYQLGWSDEGGGGGGGGGGSNRVVMTEEERHGTPFERTRR